MFPPLRFPPTESLEDPNQNWFEPTARARKEGIVAVGGHFSYLNLVRAYSMGIFPWPISSSSEILWYFPPERGVLFLEQLKLDRTTQKLFKHGKFSFTWNQSFLEVLNGCAKHHQQPTKKPAPNDLDGTWITKDLISGYCELHKKGLAHSIEVWETDSLAGGVYGVYLKNVFSAESMFFNKPYASKLALLFLAKTLQENGISWIDIQVLNDFTQKIGGKSIPSKDYLKLLNDSQQATPRALVFP